MFNTEITWTVCPTCDVKRPFMVEFHVGWVVFACLGCGAAFDEEGGRLEPWGRASIAYFYRAYREGHDQFRRYPAARVG